MQAVSYRGITPDSIALTDVVPGPGGGPGTPDGFAVSCIGGAPYCYYYRPAQTIRAVPFQTDADVTLWGLGITGLSAHGDVRVGTDLGSASTWPGTSPGLQLREGYLEYVSSWLTGRAGRQTVTSRLGYLGFDGAMARARDMRHGLDVDGYVGWGLSRGSLLPITSPELNPLGEFRPAERTIVAGADAGWTNAYVDVRANYRREVDPTVDFFASERAGVQAVLRPVAHVSLQGGSDWDLGAGLWGSAEASASYAAPRGTATAGVRRYQPYFDLWSVWMAFSPVAYHAWFATANGRAFDWLLLRARYERYQYDPAGVSTPLVQLKDDGWRYELGATVTPVRGWTVDGGYRHEFGPGASINGWDGSVSYAPSPRLGVTLLGSTFFRPLEMRYNDVKGQNLGLDAELETSNRVRVGLTASRYHEEHQRPDAGAFDLDQFRLSARLVLLFGSGANDHGLPPAIRMLPGGRAAR